MELSDGFIIGGSRESPMPTVIDWLELVALAGLK
jgi:hypothetical protein